jgi:hypothetical protein
MMPVAMPMSDGSNPPISAHMPYLSRDATNLGAWTTTQVGKRSRVQSVDGSTDPTVLGPIESPLIQIHRRCDRVGRGTTNSAWCD